MTSRSVLAFGGFALDPVARRLTHDGVVVALPERHVDVLRVLLEHAGEIVGKDALIEVAWEGIAVTDNSLEQVISSLRRTFGRSTSNAPLIQTVPRRGYRFTGTVTRTTARATDAELDALLAPHRAWLEGRSALETLSRDDVARAERAFADVLRATPDSATAHLGLANAKIFQFESSRADVSPDVAALAKAVAHAREACQLDPASGETWSTLGFILHRSGFALEALAAGRRAISLEPDNWRHHFRMAFVSWGEERLRASSRTLQLLPGLALAHWLAASVHIARQAFDAAERELEAGLVAQRDQPGPGGRFPAVGLDWLAALVKLRRGDERAARAGFEAELARESLHHLYSRECCANAWYALGSIEQRHGDGGAASRAFNEARRLVPGHPMALAAMAASVSLDGVAATPKAQRGKRGERGQQSPPRSDHGTELQARLDGLRARGATVDAAMVEAVALRASHGHEWTAPHLLAALSDAPQGPAGWILPIEPALRVWDAPRHWGAALSLLSSRAA